MNEDTSLRQVSDFKYLVNRLRRPGSFSKDSSNGSEDELECNELLFPFKFTV